MFRTSKILSALLLVPCMLCASSQGAKPEVFSSMDYIEESGDVVGVEVLVLRTGSNACVSYQRAEGAPGPLRIVRAVIRGDSLVFRIPPDSAYAGGTRTLVEVGPARWFRGRMTARGLRARIGRETAPIWLPRRTRPYFPDSARDLSQSDCSWRLGS